MLTRGGFDIIKVLKNYSAKSERRGEKLGTLIAPPVADKVLQITQTAFPIDKIRQGEYNII